MSNVIIELLAVSRLQKLTAVNLCSSILVPLYFLTLNPSTPLPSLAAATLSAWPARAQRTLPAANRSCCADAAGCRSARGNPLNVGDTRQSRNRSCGVVDNRPSQIEAMLARPRRASSRRSIAERSLRCKGKMPGRASIDSLQSAFPPSGSLSRPIEGGVPLAVRMQVLAERPTQLRSQISVAKYSQQTRFGSQAQYLIRLQEPLHGSHTRRI